MIAHVGDAEESAKKLPKLLNEFSKATGLKTNLYIIATKNRK